MLIAMAVHDTVENNRTWMTEATLESLEKTVDWTKHRLIVVDNGSCRATQNLYMLFVDMPGVSFELLDKNYGTAKAINQAWRQRQPGEHCVKMDNDVVVHQNEWVDWMEDVFERDPEIGICGLKRKDVGEAPWVEGPLNSTLRMLPHEPGQRWIVVEEVHHVIGTCQGYSSALLDKIGYLIQPGVYGFDDCLAGVRARVAGFKSVFLQGFELDHIDPGGDAYCQWKIDQANKHWPKFNNMVVLLESGLMDIHYDGGFDD